MGRVAVTAALGVSTSTTSSGTPHCVLEQAGAARCRQFSFTVRASVALHDAKDGHWLSV